MSDSDSSVRVLAALGGLGAVFAMGYGVRAMLSGSKDDLQSAAEPSAAAPATSRGGADRDAELYYLIHEAVTWARTNGLMIPRKSLVHAYELAPDFGKLATAAAYNTDWLLETLTEAATADAGFTGKLARIARTVLAQNARNPVSLAILRSDYMLDEPEPSTPGSAPPAPRLLQVELNTIASSFAALSSKTSAMHRYLGARFQHSARFGSGSKYGKAVGPAARRAASGAGSPPSAAGGDSLLGCDEWKSMSPAQRRRGLQVPNDGVYRLAEGIALAREHSADPKGIVLVICQPGEGNELDQRPLEHELGSAHGIATKRMTLAQVYASATLDTPLREGDGGGGGLRLRVPACSYDAPSAVPSATGGNGASQPDPEQVPATAREHESKDSESMLPVSVVYFRAGYSPGDYASPPALCERDRRRRADSGSGSSHGAAGGTDGAEVDGGVTSAESVSQLEGSFAGSSAAGGAEWIARLRIELSRAVKCPDVFWHLAGAKKVQQALATREAAEQLLDSTAVKCSQDQAGDTPADAASRLSAVFAGQWDLGLLEVATGAEEQEGVPHSSSSSSPGAGDPPSGAGVSPSAGGGACATARAATLEAARRALRNPAAFVIKPQREGGGNNVFGNDVAVLLRRLMREYDLPRESDGPPASPPTTPGGSDPRPGDEYTSLRALVLMDRIRAREQPATLVRDGVLQATGAPCLCEMGVYSWVVATGGGRVGAGGPGAGSGSISIVQGVCGHLVRTKSAMSDEGGVAAGYAVIDSPLLVEEGEEEEEEEDEEGEGEEAEYGT